MAQYDNDPTMSGSPMNLSAPSIYDDYSDDPIFIESQREFRTLLFDTARETGPTRLGSPVPGAEGEIEGAEARDAGTLSSKTVSQVKEVVSTSERVMWLKNYINEVAPWLDMFDVQQTFGKKVPRLAKTSAPLTYAILAISARQTERQKNLAGDYQSLQLYQESIGLLTPQLEARDPNILATCVILCCLEMMSAAPRNWRRHLDGCAALFESYGIHGFSTGIPQAVFWCYARMDLCASIISEGDQSSVLALDKWLPPDASLAQAGTLFRESGISDMYANYAVWLCARVCNLFWTQKKQVGVEGNGHFQEPFIHSWHTLWLEVQGWIQNRPADMVELHLGANDSQTHSGTFPFILFTAPCAISSNQLYHTSCLLLLNIKPSTIDTRSMGHFGSPLWHAHRICGISLTNSHHGCLNNAIQPLWLAGKLLSHPVEHKLVVDLIAKIEVSTGWSGTWRIRDLRRFWGYEEENLAV